MHQTPSREATIARFAAHGTRATRSHLLWLTAALVFLLYVMWPALRIPFGIIDDHELMEIMGDGDRLAWSQVPETAVTRADESFGRFRPVYWLFRSLESAVAGHSSTWWYVDRLLLAAVALVAIYVTAARFMRPPLAALVAVVPFVGAQSETWSRLGPTEAYAVPLLAVGVAGVVHHAVRDHRPAAMWWGFGFLLAAGLTKENFLPVAAAIIAWTALHWGLTRLRLADWLVLGAAALVTVLAAAALAYKMRGYGGVYEQVRSWETMQSWLQWATANLDGSSRFAAGVLLAVVMYVLVRGRMTRRTALGVTALVVAIALSQAFFYAGGPLVGRYLYPFALVSVLAWGAVAYFIGKVDKPRHARALTAVMVLALIWPVWQGAEAARAAAAQSAATNAVFQDALEQLERQIVDSGRRTVVLQPVEPSTDIEPVLSYARYLKSRLGVTVMTVPAPQASDSFSQEQNRLLTSWSRNGHHSLSRYQPTEDCFAIVFGAVEPLCPVAVPRPA